MFPPNHLRNLQFNDDGLPRIKITRDFSVFDTFKAPSDDKLLPRTSFLESYINLLEFLSSW